MTEFFRKRRERFPVMALVSLASLPLFPSVPCFHPAGWAEIEQKETKGTKKAALWSEQEALGRQKKYMCCRYTSREDFQQNTPLKIFVSHPPATMSREADEGSEGFPPGHFARFAFSSTMGARNHFPSGLTRITPAPNQSAIA